MDPRDERVERLERIVRLLAEVAQGLAEAVSDHRHSREDGSTSLALNRAMNEAIGRLGAVLSPFGVGDGGRRGGQGEGEA